MSLERRKISSLGQLLISLSKITADQLKEVLLLQRGQYPDKPIGELLVSLGYVTKEDIHKALALQFLYPQIELRRYKLQKAIVDLIPRDIARMYKVIPLDRFGSIITLGMLNPLDKKAVEAVEKITSLSARLFMISEEDLEHALEIVYR
ncbi:MAG: hypothetical protein WCY05_02975 [Candidatus Omnitrophota bacterium]